ncbi:hypothetical protein [Streptomyces sp. NPDC003023]|uniref:hypothetical protein n=1 Tax=Streptomyces sp. NPDC003023 TaxID=3364675 RepID=UPI0036CA163B
MSDTATRRPWSPRTRLVAPAVALIAVVGAVIGDGRTGDATCYDLTAGKWRCTA